MKTLEFLNVYNSPFVIPKPRVYIGKIALGTPIFYPRKWKPLTKKEAQESASKKFKKLVDAGKEPTLLMYQEFRDSALRSKRAVPKKIGFDLVGLGWKTKWDEYRFEWAPILSFVFFKWQIALYLKVPDLNHYWEAWLYYHYETDKTLSKKERIEKTKKEFSLTYTVSYGTGIQESINYYDTILKKKYK
jgi:hypothetical protein